MDLFLSLIQAITAEELSLCLFFFQESSTNIVIITDGRSEPFLHEGGGNTGMGMGMGNVVLKDATMTQ